MDVLETSALAQDHAVAANALRMLAVDSVEAAKSGHPGAPMGMADIAEVLWRTELRHNPADPAWMDRDRFVLSNGHGSMLIYALLHLTGYALPMEELKRFRQLHSKTPGHPEYGMTPGVETTTGPLGQGIANAVGMALAEKLLGQEFNRPGHEIIHHRTFVFLGDGCMMEGISHEACALAGTWKLDKLIAFYDDNGISIDGHVEGWFTDDTPARFEAYGWRVIRNVDGHDRNAIRAALDAALAPSGKPVLICCKTEIGHGAPGKAGSHDVHGAPLGEAEVAATRAALHWPHPPFYVPENVRDAWDARAQGASAQADWEARFRAYAQAFPELATELKRRIAGALPAGFSARADAWIGTMVSDKPVATRKASQTAIGWLARELPELLGGSADLTGSNLTDWPEAGARYIHYGVREFGMCAIINGISLHGGFLPFGGTFLVFSDYARNAIRMAALMKRRVVFVLTHDSVGLGEDGPTHQPIEHVSSLRLIPGLDVWRPADAIETAAAWRHAIAEAEGPTCLILSRQNLPPCGCTAEGASRGGYVVAAEDKPDVVLIGTGSELQLACEARTRLKEHGIHAQIVSLPCWSVFNRQSPAYRESVLPHGVRRVAVEAGATPLWHAYVGLDGAVVGIDRFGESAPGNTVFAYLGITAEKVVQCAMHVLSR